MAQKEIAAKAREIVEETELIPRTFAPKIFGEEVAEVGNEERNGPYTEEEALGFLVGLLDPSREYGEIEIDAYEKIDVPHLNGKGGEVEGNHQDIVPGIAEGLGRISPLEEEVDGTGFATQHAGEPGEEVVEHGPHEEGQDESGDFLLVESGHFHAGGQQENAGDHHKQGDGGTGEGVVHTAPEIVPGFGSFHRRDIIHTMVGHHQKNTDDLEQIEVNDTFTG